jgi:hypothetical protein
MPPQDTPLEGMLVYVCGLRMDPEPLPHTLDPAFEHTSRARKGTPAR